MLTIEKLSVHFGAYSGRLQRTSTQTIRCLDLTVKEGEIVAVVGQSGAGKSLLVHVLLGILPGNASFSGRLFFKGEKLTNERIRQLRGRSIAYIPQSVAFLNPLQRVGNQLRRSAMLSGYPGKKAEQSVRQALKRCGLPPATYASFPFELSGGMIRRVLTANATTFSADLLLADEPTNGLDPANARETLDHLCQIADHGTGVVLITHDIEEALTIADRISVFCQGVTIEEANAEDFNGSGTLRHQYTEALWSALPENRFINELSSLRATPEASGCPFSQCCSRHDEQCRNTLPSFAKKNGGRVRCWHA